MSSITNDLGKTKDARFWLFDVDTDKGHQLIAGPAALWRKIVFMLEVNEPARETVKYAVDKADIRGILCDKWTFTTTEWGGQLQVSLFFQSPDWKKFEKIDTPIPIRFTLKGSITSDAIDDKDKEIKIDQIFDFFLFEPYEVSWLEFRVRLKILEF